MKKIITIIAAVLLFTSCGDIKTKLANCDEESIGSNIHTKTLEVDGHSYIVFFAYGGLVSESYQMTAMHSESCHCKQKY